MPLPGRTDGSGHSSCPTSSRESASAPRQDIAKFDADVAAALNIRILVHAPGISELGNRIRVVIKLGATLIDAGMRSM
jgi:hypothetical protein